MNFAAEKASQFMGIGVSPTIAPEGEQGSRIDRTLGGHLGVFRSGARIPVGYGYLFIIGYCRRQFLGGE
jgi:hypothetical protein